MRWSGDGFILGFSKYNEKSYILEIFTHEHGRHKGLIRGIHSKNLRATIEPGNEVHVNWSGRLESHLGNFKIEPIKMWSSYILNQRAKLLAVTTICSMIISTMAEKQQNILIYEKTLKLIKDISRGEKDWIKNYIFWELDLLSEIGYGLDLSECAVTARRDKLKYVSPSSGRAVTMEGAGSFKDKLFLLPEFFIDSSIDLTLADIKNALVLTEYFFLKRFYEPNNLNFPKSRNHLKNILINEDKKY